MYSKTIGKRRLVELHHKFKFFKTRINFTQNTSQHKQVLIPNRTHCQIVTAMHSFLRLFRRVVRKAIARVHIVMNQKQKENLRKLYKNKKFKPLDLRPKKTRAIRRALTKHEQSIKTQKEIRKRSICPPRMYALKG